MDMNSEEPMSVCFTGHRDMPSRLSAEFREIVRNTQLAIDAAFQNGTRDFYTGGAPGYDQLCGELVLQLKKREPEVRLHILLPYPGYAANSGSAHERLVAAADETVCLYSHYFKGCFLMRDRELVSRAESCIAYLRKPRSGTAFTVSCARQKGIKVILI